METLLKTASGQTGGTAKAKGGLLTGDRTERRIKFLLPGGYKRFGKPVYSTDSEGSAGGRAEFDTENENDATVLLVAWADLLSEATVTLTAVYGKKA